VKGKRLFVGVLMLMIVSFASQSVLAQDLDGFWFKLKAVVKGYDIDKATGNSVKHNFKVPMYVGFVWDGVSKYDVRVFTRTAPGVWTNTYNDSVTPIYNENFIQDWGVILYVNATDYVGTFHTAYIKYVLNPRTGAVKKAKYSGNGQVVLGNFNGGATDYLGSVAFSGSTVPVSKLPFTP